MGACAGGREGQPQAATGSHRGFVPGVMGRSEEGGVKGTGPGPLGGRSSWHPYRGHLPTCAGWQVGTWYAGKVGGGNGGETQSRWERSQLGQQGGCGCGPQGTWHQTCPSVGSANLTPRVTSSPGRQLLQQPVTQTWPQGTLGQLGHCSGSCFGDPSGMQRLCPPL